MFGICLRMSDRLMSKSIRSKAGSGLGELGGAGFLSSSGSGLGLLGLLLLTFLPAGFLMVRGVVGGLGLGAGAVMLEVPRCGPGLAMAHLSMAVSWGP